MSANATAAAPPAVPRCVGLCESTARTIGMLFMCISVFALAAGVVSSLVESFTGFRMRVYRSRATVAKENSFAAGRDPFALLYCLQMMALVSLGGGTGSATTRSPAALDAFAGWFQFANLQIPALSLFKHYGLRHTCDDRALDQFLGTVELNVILLVCTCALREILRLAAQAWALRVKGEYSPPGFLLFRHWELLLLLTQSMGHSIAGGKAIASACVGWRVIGASAVFFVPFLFMVILHFHVRGAIEGSAALVYFDGAKWADNLLLKRTGAAGVWRTMPGRQYPESHFLQLYGKYFERFRRQCWGFATILVLKRLLIGLSFALPDLRHRSVAIFILCLVEVVCMLVVQPHSEFKLFVRSVIVGVCHTIAFGLLLLQNVARISEAAATTWVIVFEMAAGIFALVDQMLVVVEEFEETHRNLRDVDNLLQSRDPDDVLTLALKTELEKQMEEERLIALAKVKEREMLEKLEKLMKQRDIDTITEDSEEEANGSETKEDEEPEPLLYFTRKRLVELGHWNNDPLLKRAEEPDSSYSGAAIHNGPVAQAAAAVLPPPQIWTPRSALPSDLAESFALDALGLGRTIGHVIQRATDSDAGTQTPLRDQPRLEMEQKPSLQEQNTRETAELPEETQVSLPSLAAQLRREHVISVAPPTPEIILEASEKPPSRPPRLVQRVRTHSDRNAIHISTEHPSQGQQDAVGVHPNGGLGEKSQALASIRRRVDQSRSRMAQLQSQIPASRSHASQDGSTG